MEKIILILSISASGYVVSEFIIDMVQELYNKMPIKPFSCGYCLSFWFGFGYSVFDGLFYSIAFGALCAVVNALIFKILNR